MGINLMEEQHEDRRNDSKYRRYVAALEKCLQSFESVNEWADVISFLSRLGKVFQSFPSFQNIPFKLNLAKRLAQCLNPALPAGVHQKTLEVYEMVFRKIGVQELSKDLSVYSFGLFPFFEHSTTLVKTSLLELYDVYLIPLGIGLRPSLRPLVLSIILGLEEENSEHFVKVNNLLIKIKESAGISEFYDAIWTGLLISPHHRLAIVNFILKNIPQQVSNVELIDICVNNTKLVSSSLSAALQDSNQLVVRGSLDILLKYFPVDKKFFDQQQYMHLYQSSMIVVTRRDMSLTRRFYNWILSTPEGSESESLSQFSKDILIFSFKSFIQIEEGTTEQFSKPFKLLVFLLDKSIISDPLLKECLFDLTNLLIRSLSFLTLDEYDKVLVSANLLFRMLELDAIWNTFCFKINEMNLQSISEVGQVIRSISYSIQNLSVCDESSSMIHLHLTIFLILSNLFLTEATDIPYEVLRQCLELCLCLMAKLSYDSMDFHSFDFENDFMKCKDLSNILLNRKESLSQINSINVKSIMYCNLMVFFNNCDKIITFSSDPLVQTEVFEISSRFILLTLSKLNLNSERLTQSGIYVFIEKMRLTLAERNDLIILKSLIDQISDFSVYWAVGVERVKIRDVLIDQALSKLWSKYLENDDNRSFICSLLSKICRIFPLEVDVAFATILASAIQQKKTSIIEKFSYFFDVSVSSHLLTSVPFRLSIMVLLDSMTNVYFKLKKCSSLWIFTITKNLERFLIPTLSSAIDIIECSISHLHDYESSKIKTFKKTFDKGTLIFNFELLLRLMAVNFDNVLNFLLTSEIDSYLLIQWSEFCDLLRQKLNIDILDKEYKLNYYNVLLILCLPLLSLEELKYHRSNRSSIKGTTLDLLSELIKSVNSDSIPLVSIVMKISISKLSHCIANSQDIEKQQRFLQFFKVLFSNSQIATLFSFKDIIFLGEVCKKMLKTSMDAGSLENWTNFTISLALLPKADIGIILIILNESLVFRLRSLSDNLNISCPKSLLSSIFLNIAKLSTFYLAAKSCTLTGNVSAHNQLRNSISGILSEVIVDSSTGFADSRLLLCINIEIINDIIAGYLNAHFWLTNFHLTESRDGFSTWSQCMSDLSKACGLLYSISPTIFTQVLFTLFSNHNSDSIKYDFCSFFRMFYHESGVEFIHNMWINSKSGKEPPLKAQEIFLRLMLKYSVFDSDDNLIIEFWNILSSMIKEYSSSNYKYKPIFFLLIQNTCHFLSKLNRIDCSRFAKDQDLIQRFFENSIIYASKLNDPTQWASKIDDVIEIESDRFSDVLIEAVKDKHIGRCMDVICRIMIPKLSSYYVDSERISSVLAPIINNLITPNFKSTLRFSLMGQISVFCFKETLKYNINSLKVWKRDLWESFFDNSFLWMPKYYFNVMNEAFKLLMLDSDRFSEVLGRISLSSTASMFLSKDAEVLNKALNIRRLSFLIFWANDDSFRMHLPSLQEKFVDLTKYYNGYILGEIFFLIRVLLLRLNDDSISSLWPLIMTELVQLFENNIKSDSISSSDLYAIFQACKLIDMMLTLRTSSILLYHWLFFDSSGDGGGGLFLRLEMKIKTFSNSTAFKLHSQDIIHASSNRRPLLSSSIVKEPYELLNFLQNAKSHLSHDYLMVQCLDMVFIDSMTKKDLLESIEIK